MAPKHDRMVTATCGANLGPRGRGELESRRANGELGLGGACGDTGRAVGELGNALQHADADVDYQSTVWMDRVRHKTKLCLGRFKVSPLVGLSVAIVTIWKEMSRVFRWAGHS